MLPPLPLTCRRAECMKTINICSHQGLLQEAMGSSLLGVSLVAYKRRKEFFSNQLWPQ